MFTSSFRFRATVGVWTPLMRGRRTIGIVKFRAIWTWDWLQIKYQTWGTVFISHNDVKSKATTVNWRKALEKENMSWASFSEYETARSWEFCTSWGKAEWYVMRETSEKMAWLFGVATSWRRPVASRASNESKPTRKTSYLLRTPLDAVIFLKCRLNCYVRWCKASSTKIQRCRWWQYFGREIGMYPR